MKKITTLATIVCLGISTMMAQTQRTILYEEFTGENCGPCAGTNPYVDAAINPDFPGKIILLRYQCNIPSAPGAGSLYADNPSEVGSRQTYYAVPFAPYARFNGIQLPDPQSQGNDGHAIFINANYYPNIINDSAIVNAPFGLNMTWNFNSTADSVIVNVTVTAAMAYNSSTLKLQVSLSETDIHFATAPGSNGEKDFYHVMRKMLPSNTGTTLQAAWTNGAQQSFVIKAKIPTYIKNKAQIEMVGWVEEQGTSATTRRVHNAAYGAPQQLADDASTSAIAGLNALSCNTTINPVATISNTGNNNLTSCTISYTLDATAPQTISWNGTLAPGATATVAIPPITTTAGSHTLAVRTTLPNGNTDVNPGNDTKKTTFSVLGNPISAPVTEGFVASTFPPTDWSIINPDGGQYTWKRNTSVGGYQTTTNSAYIQFYNNTNDGDIDDLFMPQVDLTTITNPELKFDFAYNYYDDGTDIFYDSLEVMLSTDCGVTWNQLFLDGGPGLTTATTFGNANAYTPVAAEWQSKSFSLNTYASSNAALVKFVARNHYGNNLYLDNINITAAVGIQSVNGNIHNMNVYPNPATSQTSVKLNVGAAEKVNLNIYNSLGQQVFTKAYDLTAGENKLDISTEKMANGIYTVSVSSAKGTSQTKLTISK